MSKYDRWSLTEKDDHFFNKTNANTWVEIINKKRVTLYKLYSYNTNSIILYENRNELYAELDDTKITMAYEHIEELDGEYAVSWPGKWGNPPRKMQEKSKKVLS